MTSLFRFLSWLAAFWVRRLSDDTLRRLGRLLFARTERSLERALRDVRGAQEERLLRLVSQNTDTAFGRAHAFADIRTADAYRSRVPIQPWQAVAPWVDRLLAGESQVLTAEDAFFFATTSGTTGRRKAIPVTSAFIEECRVTTRLLFRTTLLTMPGALRGKRLTMRSPALETLAPGKEGGSITLALSGGLSEAEHRQDAVPALVYRLRDFATRYRLCVRFAAQEDVTSVSAINPSTLLLFAQTLEEHAEDIATALEEGTLGEGLELAPEEQRALLARARRAPAAARRIRESAARHGAPRLCDLWPGLAGLVCWKGGSAPWYLERLLRSYGPVPVLDHGYVASEGCFGAPLSAEGAASLLPPHGHFFEFMAEEQVEAVRRGELPTRLLHELEVGRRYYVVVTTGAGLYRYDINDVVEVVGKQGDAPLVVFRHKGGSMASITGEKLAESHVVQAMSLALSGTGVHLDGFAMSPCLPEGEAQVPYYVLALDGGDAPLSDEAVDALAARCDAELQRDNLEYEAKRTSLRLGPVRGIRLPRGAWQRLRAERVQAGAPDAHVKIPHLSPDGALLLRLGLAATARAHAARLPCRQLPERQEG